MSLTRSRLLLSFSLAFVLLFPLTASGAQQRASAAIDIRGDWSMPAVAGGQTYPQIWSILTEDLQTGKWTGHIKGNAAYTLDGTVSGTTLVIHSQYGSYQSNGKATLVGSGASLKVVNGSFSDTNGTKGTFSGTRLSGPPSGGGPSPLPDQICLGGCSSLDVHYDATADWQGDSWDFTQQAPLPLSLGCSAPGFRFTQSAEGPSGCDVSASLTDTLGSLEQVTQNDRQQALDILRQIQSDPGTDQTGWATVENELQQQSQLDYQQAVDIWKAMRETSPPSDAPSLKLDSDLQADFPVDDRSPASARQTASVARMSAPAMPDPGLVLQSVLAPHPSRAARQAFKTALQLATSPTPSPARGQARLTLVITVAAGRARFASELKGHPQLVIASGHAHLGLKAKRALKLAQTAQGGRVLRILAVVGLSRKASLKLNLSARHSGRQVRAVRTLRVK